MSLDLKVIKWYPLPENEYHKVEYPKKQIVLHHTASGGNSKGDIDFWASKASPGAISTAFCIDRDGIIWQCFSSKYYAAHLGTPTSTFKKFGVKNTVDSLHKGSIGIELDNWGWLIEKNGKFYSYAGTEIKPENVITYPDGFLGYKYFEKYPDAQLKSLKDLVGYLATTYKIETHYNSDMWKVSKDALSGKNGIYTHVSYRESGKWDCHPQSELINMLNTL